jgi:hypothetical protein
MSAESRVSSLVTGTIHGKHLDLDQETGLPDGQAVSVMIRPVKEKLPPGEGLRRAFGGWADDPEGVDKFVEEVRRLRDMESERETGL